ncbi:hypothetical protein LCGC14_0413930 [marine sediment metagenome]|uniref:PD-(D/E)XK endonuclease-like domain-containing protein n=1 Tax=marine sediment metagenome TaxID=412755 RepID=A0A0F9TAV9_9ZZZZ
MATATKKEGPIRWEVKEGKNVYKISFSEGNHQYRVVLPGEKKSISVPSVTSIIGQLDKPGLVFWAANLTADYCLNQLVNPKTGKIRKVIKDPKEVFELAKRRHSEELEKAANKGKAAHRVLENWLLHGKVPLVKSGINAKYVNTCWQSFTRWQKAVNFKEVLGVEQRVFCVEHHYAGTYDLKCILGETEYVVDYKTSKAVREPEYPMQLAAYAYAEDAWAFTEGKLGIGVLHFDPDTGEFRWHDYTNVMGAHMTLFSTLRKVHTHKKICAEVVKSGAVSYLTEEMLDGE